MSKRWISAMLVFFLAINGLVVAGDSATHASHDAPGGSLHAHDQSASEVSSAPSDHDGCDSSDHDCHGHASFAPLSDLGGAAFPAGGAAWQCRLRNGAVLSGDQPPVPPPNTVVF